MSSGRLPDVEQHAARASGGTWWQSPLLDFTHDAIIVWELRGDGVVFWNSAAERLYGWTRDEAAGRITHELLRTRVANSDVVALEGALSRRSVWVGDLQHTARDGRELVVESRIVLLERRENRWLVLEVNRDVTEIRRSSPRPAALLDAQRLHEIAADGRPRFEAARPFPHAVIDGLLPDDVLDRAVRELPDGSDGWKAWETPHESKQVCSDVRRFGPAAESIVHALNGSVFLRFLEELTGIEGLIADPHLHAAGYMRSGPGGFLDLHEDFSTHRELRLDRRINVLLYLNRDWKPEWGGQLELHSNDPLDAPSHEEVRIEPVFNRMVIFETPGALHGHRTRVATPDGRARLCLSWYYFTAPPVPDWATRSRPVRFAGGFDPGRALSRLVYLCTPPIVIEGLRRAWKATRRRG